MRNVYLLLVLAMMLPMSIFADIADFNAAINKPHQMIDVSEVTVTPSDVVNVKIGDYPAPQMAFNVLTQNTEYFWQSYWGGVTPIAYEPKSGTLVYISTDRERVELEGGAVTTHAHVYLHFSNDGGKSWTNERVYTLEDAMLFFPSVAVLNPTGTTNPIDFKYVVTVTAFLPEEGPQGLIYRGRGNYYLYFYGGGWDQLEFQQQLAPQSNNPGGGQQWNVNNQRMAAVSSAKGDHFYVYGTLSPQDGYQYGAYGIAYIDFTGDANPASQIPEAWNLNQFRRAEQLTSSWNAPMRLDVDVEGNVYAFFFNMFADNENYRCPAFSKSTDNGRTWSELVRMPEGLINDFVSAYNANVQLGINSYPYTDWDVVVTGVDEFSMFQRYVTAEGAAAETANWNGHIVEFSYKNNNWQPVKRVGDYFVFQNGNQYPPVAIQINTENDPIFSDEFVANFRYQELQAAKTADGNDIVVKWINYPADNIAVLATPHQLYNNFMETVDTLMTTDIMIATRGVNENQWGQYNITQDLWYNKGTYIPDVVPSASIIPVIETITQQITNPENVRVNYPYFTQNIIGDRTQGTIISGTLYTVAIAIFDSENPSVVRNDNLQRPGGLVGVSVLEQMPFALENISPNPANDVAYVNFTLENAANVRIDIVNSMGQSVKTVNLNNVQAGPHTVDVITNQLPAGAYFYTITVNGKSQTKLLNVVR
ncbi:MAG: T9SS type A sorting domain-containing protein [Candidatus Kapabacteria bacterium]|nr:T9SS type A sorting domain-containing protein [Ignavibacteriota bacterium]MCW5884495.1 T9SS type A sorting domain-containing protein [Candidatus Kapabacteria bacterium]